MSLRSTLRPVAVLLAGLMSLAGVVIATTVPAGAANLPTSLSTTTVATGAAATSTTSAPVNVVGTTTQSIATYFPSGSLRFNGNITAPDGWTKEYTCNGGTTWDALWYYGCVNGVRTVGDLTSLGINAGNQYWQGSRRSGSNGAARIQLNGAGDGWNAVVSSDGTRVYNVYHHGSPNQLDCHVIDGGARCAGFPAVLSYTTSPRSGLTFDGSGNIWVAGGNDTSDGFNCVTTAGASCGNKVTMNGASNVGAHWSWCGHCGNFQNEVYANGKVLGLDTTTYKVGCWDTSADDACSTQPSSGFDIGLSNSNGGHKWVMTSSLAVGHKVYFTSGGSTTEWSGAEGGGLVSCFDTDTLATCTGSWPATAGGPELTPAPTGQAGVICSLGYTGAKCHDDQGAVKSSSSVLDNLLSTVLAPSANDGDSGYGNAATQGSRIYWSRGSYSGTHSVQLECFDQNTNAECAGFPLLGSAFNDATNGAAQGSVYAVTADPTRSNCIWTNDNYGNILSWNTRTGSPGCVPPGSDFIATYQGSKVMPRLSCAGDAVSAWKKLEVTSVSGGSFSRALLSIDDSNGSPVAGWQNVPMALSHGVPTIGLGSLSPVVTGRTPKFSVKLVGLDASAGLATVTVSKVGSAPQLCVGLTAQAKCPTLAEMADGARPQGSITTVTNQLDVTTSGGPMAPVTATRSLRITAPTLAQCQQTPAPPPSTLSVPDQIGTVNLNIQPPNAGVDTGGAVPKTLAYRVSVDGGNTWRTVTPDRFGNVSISDLGSTSSNACVKVRSENLAAWSSASTDLGCVTTHGRFAACNVSTTRFSIAGGLLHQGDPATSMTAVGTKGKSLNAIGLNRNDCFIYGIRNGGTPTLVKVASDGTQVTLGAVAGLPNGNYLAGDWDPTSGKLIVSSDEGTLAAIDLAALTATTLTIPANVQAAGGIGKDLAIFGGSLWSVNTRVIVGIDLTSFAGSVVTIPTNATQGTGVGAIWSTGGTGMRWTVGQNLWSFGGSLTSADVVRVGISYAPNDPAIDGASGN